MFNQKEKMLLEREIIHYRKEQELAIEIEIQQKKTANWEMVQEARLKCFKTKLELEVEIAKLQAKKEALAEVMTIKDQEIALLKDVISSLIKR